MREQSWKRDVVDDLLHLGEPLALLRALAVLRIAASGDSKRAATMNRPSSVVPSVTPEEPGRTRPELRLPPITEPLERVGDR